VLAPVAAAGWVALGLTELGVRIALLRRNRSHGLVSVLWGLGFGLFLWAGAAAVGLPDPRAFFFGLVAGGAIALVVYLRGSGLDDQRGWRPGAYYRRLIERRRPGVPRRERATRTELEQARIEVARGDAAAALFSLEEAERMATAQRKLAELVEVRELAAALPLQRGEPLVGRVDEHIQGFPADELAAAGIAKEPSREELGAQLARDRLGDHEPVTTPELSLARAALDRGDSAAALHWLKEARRVAVAQRKLDELLEVYRLAERASETRLVSDVEADLASFA